MITYKASAY
ncbi:hypothetical protein ACHAXR_000897 [Thalassiosira sp. AJA248-18]